MFDVFNVISLLGGLALFLFGMSVLGSSLEKVAGGRVEKTLQKLTSNAFKGVLLGAVVTAAIQSSSATTVIVVGLVNAGILKLRSAVGVILGANIGTTVTAQIIRLGDLEQSGSMSLFLQILKPTTLAPLASIVGILIFMGAKRSKFKDIGTILIGFGILFNGMFAMEAAVSGLRDVPQFQQLFAMFTNPLLGVLVGAVVTGIIQSSSASIGILQALSSTGAITYSSALPIILGQNIGTCVTPILSSIGANRNAKRAAMVHLYFNLIGTVIFLIGIYSLQYLILPDGFAFWNTAIDKGGIANFHTFFNVVVTAICLPFSGLLAKLAEKTVRDKGAGDAAGPGAEEKVLDERLLQSPAVALNQCHNLVLRMAQYSRQNFQDAASLYDKFDRRKVEQIMEFENSLDRMEDRLGNYLVKLADIDITEEESKDVTYLLHLISEFERIGDYSINIVEQAQILYDSGTSLSDAAMAELHTLFRAVGEIIDMAIVAYHENDMHTAVRIEPLEETIDTVEDTLKYKHIERLKAGDCTIDTGVVFLDLLTNLERISDQCSNIAVYMIGRNQDQGTVNRHEYLQRLHTGDTEEYSQELAKYMAKYYNTVVAK